MTLQALVTHEAYTRVELRPGAEGVGVQVKYPVSAAAWSAKCEFVPWSEFIGVAAVIDRLSAAVCVELEGT